MLSIQRSRNEVVSDLGLWKPKHGKRSAGGQVRTFVPRDCLPAAMDDRVGWRKKARGGEGGRVVDLVVVVVVVCNEK